MNRDMAESSDYHNIPCHNELRGIQTMTKTEEEIMARICLIDIFIDVQKADLQKLQKQQQEQRAKSYIQRAQRLIHKSEGASKALSWVLSK